MKPLIRYTIGPTAPLGMDCLKRAIFKIKQLYPQCDIAVCYNQIKKPNIKGVELVDQSDFRNSLKYVPKDGFNVHWKLFPPRLRLDSHEIWIDNDIIIFKHIEKINTFLDGQIFLGYEGLHRLYGNYENIVPKGCFNSGVFGLPPNFDFESFLASAIDQGVEKKWVGKFDEQGLVANTVLRHENVIITQKELPILEKNWQLTKSDCCGYHFVSLNVTHNHAPYRRFLSKEIL